MGRIKTEILHESQFINLPDEDLKEAIGYLFNRIKALKEGAKNDVKAQELKATYDEYVDACYNDERKDLEKLLKAARYVAEGKGIQWKSLK
jgi:hypothetical protein